ncbi:hypothetical protein DYB30_009054 [Aphanomyces astaci]|uniref:Uncharacterized protein n=1 Tax=Aphanomyces astaci TaxID=112090 RepID=A0A397D5U2_APHAT|nr:hypothetical protein DYB30_009054 [Aphanomyces astaci]
MRTFQTGDLPAIDRRLAATASLPTPTPPEETFNMLIACKSAVATFPLQVMLDSLATTHQPATWATAKGVCRDFMRVKNIGISFNCTDRDMVTRLGGLKLNICGRPFLIRDVDSVATDHPGIVVHAFPAHYNSFEVLEDADDEIDATPAPYIVTVDGNPNLYATHARSNANLQCYNAFNTDVESMTVGELTDYLEHYANSFQSEDDPSIALAMIQANPGHLAPILDVQTPKNIEVLVHKAPGHALQRFIQSHSYLDRIIDAMQEQANATLPQPLWAHLWPEAATSNNPTSLVLSSLVPNSANHSLVLALAQFCLFLQLNQPEIYFNAIKVSALVHQACHKHGGLPRLATLTLAPHFLWSDATLCALAASPMGDYLLTRSNLAIPIQQAIMVLATLHPLDVFTLPCYSA